MDPSDPERRLRMLGWWLHGLGAVVSVALVWLGAVLVFGPLGERTAACIAEKDELDAVIGRKAAIRAEHARLARELAEAQRQEALLQTRIPDSPHETDFLAQVTRLGEEVGLEIVDYRPGAPVSGTSYSTVQVDLMCRGGHEEVCRFLAKLAALPRQSTVSRLQVDADGTSTKLSVKISLILYFGVQPAPGPRTRGPTDA